MTGVSIYTIGNVSSSINDSVSSGSSFHFPVSYIYTATGYLLGIATNSLQTDIN